MSVAVRRARPVSNALLGTLLFAGTEAMLFFGLGASFVILRSTYTVWPPMGQPRLPVEATAITTLVLVASGVFGQLAASATTRGAALRHLGTAWVLGAAFLAVQGTEWVALLRYGMSAGTVYGSLFYAVVGTHAVHVAVSLGVLAWGVRGLARGTWGAVEVGALRAWWWFVVGIWPVLYALVYLW